MKAKTAARVTVNLYLHDLADFLNSLDPQDRATAEQRREIIEDEVREILPKAPWVEYLGIRFVRGDAEIVEVDLIEQPATKQPRMAEVGPCAG